MIDAALHVTAKQMVAPGKGLLAADESERTAGARLRSIGVENTEEMRRQYRMLFLGTEGIEEYLSGVILHDETIGQKDDAGVPVVEVLASRGVLPGIKVDKSTHALPGFPDEAITHGIDGLPERLAHYGRSGAKFTKWRSVISIAGETLPTRTSIEANAHAMALYAAYAQAAGLVPIVEPEVLYAGDHSLRRCEEVVKQTLEDLFTRLHEYKVDLGGTILKSSMVLPGSGSGQAASAHEVAKATLRAFRDAVPPELPGIVFLSGGQTPDQATRHLNAIASEDDARWELSFSYARALQQPSLEIWRGNPANVAAAQEKFLERLRETAAARDGKLEANHR